LKIPILIILLSFLIVNGCSTVGTVQPPTGKAGSLALVDLSEGLPRDGLWRQNIALADMNGDGRLDIVAPPPRKSEGGQRRPTLFSQDLKGWREGVFDFPVLKDYAYGGIATGDINGDGFPDIILSVHQGRIIVLENNGRSGFVERAFPAAKNFHSRMVAASDINGDGRTDVIALSEAPFQSTNRQKGILVGINKQGDGWDLKIIEESEQHFGDSMAIGDINGDGNNDIAIASLTDKELIKTIWFGDGKGAFVPYNDRLIGEASKAFFVAVGDLDGDGKDEVVFKESGYGSDAKVFLSAFTWKGPGFADISGGLGAIERPMVFALSDIDGDRKKELIVLSVKGIGIYNYTDKGFVERGFYPLPVAETAGAYDLKAGRNRDGSLVIVYNLGRQEEGLNRGIRAYVLK